MTPTRSRISNSGDKLHNFDTRHRRQRAKHSIVPLENLIDPTELSGKYLHMTQEQFDTEVCDNESALAFAARVGLIQNTRKCPKCQRDMALCKFNNSCGYRWVCRRTEDGRRFTCSVRGMRKDTILDDRLVGILTMLRIMYMYSQNIPSETIITNLDIGHVRSAKTILTRLRDMIDGEIKQMNPNLSEKDVEITRKLFLESQVLDRFGHMLHWGARYKNERINELNKEGENSEDNKKDSDEHSVEISEMDTDDFNVDHQINSNNNNVEYYNNDLHNNNNDIQQDEHQTFHHQVEQNNDEDYKPQINSIQI